MQTPILIRKYTFSFAPILNNGGSVHFVDHAKSIESTVGFTICDKEFGCRVRQQLSSVVADLIDLAVAIHASDRLAFQPFHQGQNQIHVLLPVRYPELLSSEIFRAKIENLLEWTTGSRWTFDFQKRRGQERSVVEQPAVPTIPQGCEVALWSGGLDAFAGAYTRLKANTEKSFILFGSGSNSIVHAKQGATAKEIESIFPGRSLLYRLPLNLHDSNTHNKNLTPRARGIVFMMLGAACAYLMGRKELHVYENGIGAINLHYRSSSVGLDHSRSVHPLTLLMTSDVVSTLFDEPFQVRNPFLFWTKAQICRAIASDGRSDLPPLTRSCDSPHRQRPAQCGYCSSCILRKQAIAASNMKDKTHYVITHGNRPVADPSVYLRHMLAQVDTFRYSLGVSDEPAFQWGALTRKFHTLDDIVDRASAVEGLTTAAMQNNLLQLYRTYVLEWDDVKPQLSAGLLDRKNAKPSVQGQSVA